MYKVKLLYIMLSKKMWPKVTLFALMGIVCALAAVFFKNSIPDTFSEAVGAETAVNILSILSSSMLAVTTFSLSTMVSAYGSATSGASPRATALITEDKTTQNALAIFLGTFVFSLVGIIALNMGAYEGGGRFILFVATLAVLVLIIGIFIRWIDRLTTLGRVGETSRLVEQAAVKAITARADRPSFGCNSLRKMDDYGATALALKAPDNGYVRLVDIKDLGMLADKHELHLYVAAMPGDYVTPGDALCWVDVPVQEQVAQKIRKCFTLGEQREFDQDPRFGVTVLAEIGSRSASGAVRDVGTAMDIVVRLTRVLETYVRERKEDDIEYSRVWVPELDARDLFADAFNAIAREAAPMFEVHLRLQQSLAYLHDLGNEDYRKCAAHTSSLCLAYSDDKLLVAEQKDALHEVAVAGSAHRQLDISLVP